jgi:hypothetical protein
MFAAIARQTISVHYSPVGQTLSVLAETGRYSWIMTAGFVVSASC